MLIMTIVLVLLEMILVPVGLCVLLGSVDGMLFGWWEPTEPTNLTGQDPKQKLTNIFCNGVNGKQLMFNNGIVICIISIRTSVILSIGFLAERRIVIGHHNNDMPISVSCVNMLRFLLTPCEACINAA